MPHTVSQLEQTLRARRFAITTELTPPVSFNPDDLLEKARPLKGLADAVNVTDGASARAHMSALAAAALLAREGIEPILQLTCRDRNRIALQADLMGAAALGIHNLLLLTGDDPKAGDQPDTKPVFDVDSTALTAMARAMRDQGELPTGRKIAGQASFFLAPPTCRSTRRPAGSRASSPARSRPAHSSRKPSSAWIQGVVARYAQRLAANDTTRALHLLIGIAPLRSAKSARWMKEQLYGTIIPDEMVERLERAADPAAEGARICVELIETLATIPGVAGVHIMAPANEAVVPDVIAQARQRLSKQ